MRRDNLGANHPKTIGAMTTNGVVLRDLGKLEKAWTVEQRALAKAADNLGTRHWRTSRAALVAARIQDRRGDDARAADLRARYLHWLLDEDAANLADKPASLRGELRADMRHPTAASGQ